MASRSGKDALDIENEGPLTQARLILCEGKSDASFIRRLLNERKLTGFQIGFPNQTTARAFGKDAFGSYLEFLKPRRGFNGLRHLVVLADADENPESSLSSVQEHLRKAQFAAPDEVGRTNREQSPSVTILMLPGPNSKGNLETLLLQAVQDHALAKCFEEYRRCCGIDGWPIGAGSKAMLTAIIAATCRKNPSCSLTWMWGQEGNPISLTHTAFDALVLALTDIAAKMPTAGG